MKHPRPLTVGDLRRALKGVDDSLPVIMGGDPEANGYQPLYAAEQDKYCRNGQCWWNQEDEDEGKFNGYEFQDAFGLWA